jgi:hypothetical protein
VTNGSSEMPECTLLLRRIRCDKSLPELTFQVALVAVGSMLPTVRQDNL